MKLDNSSYRKLISFFTPITVIGLVISGAFISLFDFFFLVLDALDGGENLFEYLLEMLLFSLFYLLPQGVLYLICNKVENNNNAKDELLDKWIKAKQTSKKLFICWIAMLIISFGFMFIWGY